MSIFATPTDPIKDVWPPLAETFIQIVELDDCITRNLV